MLRCAPLFVASIPRKQKALIAALSEVVFLMETAIVVIVVVLNIPQITLITIIIIIIIILTPA